MTSSVRSKDRLFNGYSSKLHREYTGVSTARPYEFGKRTLTDNDDCSSTDRSLLKSLNTIKLIFDWGSKGKLKLKKTFRAPRELGPVHEKEAKKGHSGAAKLGRTISVSSAPRNVDFQRSKSIEPVTFVFCYGPEEWLRARDIIPHVPEPETYGGLKRERSATPEIVDVDQLETDDDEIQIIKHMVPASTSYNKKQKISTTASMIKLKVEED
ncbi:unnamed protein product [Rhizoctonia solani]|nr:unnamed protein product [Rhizoctonia solani]